MATDVLDLSADEARLLALDAQGLLEGRRAGVPTVRDVRRVIDRLRLLQIDSINVLVRAHYLPIYSRLGPYDRAILDRLTYEKRELFEFWAHAASLVPTRLHRLLRWRMDRKAWPELERLRKAHPGIVETVLRAITDRGGLAASDLDEAEADEGRGPWWGWGRAKHVLEWLFATGAVTTRERRNFERVYDLTHRVLPARHIEGDAPAPDEAKKALLLESASALGVATARDLADYFRIHGPTARRLIASLVEEGGLVLARVEGWKPPAYALPKSSIPRRRASARTLLSPFDSLIFERARTERLFGLRFRVEIYTPASKRIYGYYVLPFLLDGDLCARVDLKADRATGRLLVRAAHLEPGRDAAQVAGALAHEVREMARWLDLERIAVTGRGELARRLRAEVGPAGPRLRRRPNPRGALA